MRRRSAQRALCSGSNGAGESSRRGEQTAGWSPDLFRRGRCGHGREHLQEERAIWGRVVFAVCLCDSGAFDWEHLCSSMVRAECVRMGPLSCGCWCLCACHGACFAARCRYSYGRSCGARRESRADLIGTQIAHLSASGSSGAARQSAGSLGVRMARASNDRRIKPYRILSFFLARAPCIWRGQDAAPWPACSARWSEESTTGDLRGVPDLRWCTWSGRWRAVDLGEVRRWSQPRAWRGAPWTERPVARRRPSRALFGRPKIGGFDLKTPRS